MQKVRRGAFLSKTLLAGLTISGVFLLDRLTKIIIVSQLEIGAVVPVVPELFNIVHTRNRGAAFGLFGGGGLYSVVFLSAVSLIAIGLLIHLIRESDRRLQTFAFSLIVGGALGNLFDRVLFGEVIDFLDFHIKGYHWPAFNVADSAITVGVGLALFSLYRR